VVKEPLSKLGHKQNRRQKVVNKGLYVCAGGLRSCRGCLTFKFEKNSENSQHFIFQFGDLGLCLGG